ncbi:hypothetical protein [Kordia jejudonensis]|uniref:hypothetical protein n=1 Tax=Kordia jejudonensis TaxID=1348245 RepID=UPI000629367B|nr:hypothetical protein [Kordia jejudonensis]
MNKTFYLALGGQLMIASGLILFFSDKIDITVSKTLIPVFMVLAGLCTLLFSTYDKLPKIAKQYHFIQGVGFIVYATIIFALINSLQGFLLTTIYFVIMFGMFELLFAFGVLNSKHSINKEILISRILAGIVNLVGGFILLMMTFDDEKKGLFFTSILLAIGGISILIFSSKVRKYLHNS